MKARVKATGEIGIVSQIDVLLKDDFISFSPNNVELMTNYADCQDKLYDELDEVYWINLKHQYAGMAMNALLLTNNIRNGDLEGMRECNTNAMTIAHALVEKLKEEKV